MKLLAPPRTPPSGHAIIATRSAKRIASLALASQLWAIPLLSGDAFLSPDDETGRHHLSYLNDSGIINLPITSWPLSSEAITSELASVDARSLSVQERAAYDALQLSLQMRAPLQVDASLGNSRQPLRGFGNSLREPSQVQVSLHHHGDTFLGKLAAAYAGDPLDGEHWRLDDSYVAVDLSNWRLGAGSIDRWWGPGWQSSLILSNNARPTLGVFVTRNQYQRADLPVFRWLGPWDVSAFASQLESDRHIPNAKLLGGRFAFKPQPWIELGVVRTAQWGGEGRPESASSLWNLLLGRDNRGDDGIEDDGANEPGNQLGGIDWRIVLPTGPQPVTFYGQVIGEDEAGGLPSRTIGMVGIEMPVFWGDSHGRIYLEASDTSMRFHSDPLFDSTYNHSIYRTGYRYEGRSIGASTDNDSRVLVLGGVHALPEGQSLSWKALFGTLNRGGGAGRNPVAPLETETLLLSVEYERQLSDQLRAAFTAYHAEDTLWPSDPIAQNGIQARLTWTFEP